FQPTIFKKVSKTAINLWKNQGDGRLSANILLTQLGLYRNRDYPFDDPYVEANGVLERLQAMAQMHSYLVTNAKSEL
ncbi:315_t:CDS:2, partial [Funneliformis mosseae]